MLFIYSFLKLQNASNEVSFFRLLDSDDYDFRFECGISQPITTIKLTDRDEIITTEIHFQQTRFLVYSQQSSLPLVPMLGN